MKKPLFQIRLLMIVLVGVQTAGSTQPELFRLSAGGIQFKSDAPLEVIQASSEELRGLIDPQKRSFAFSVPMNTFQGFNSPLQQEHFNENYLESSKYPNATFSGKIIEDIDFEAIGEYTIRAKGILKIHGIEQERIIKSKLSIRDKSLEVIADFSVLLEDHNITIPKIVYQKIAEEIQVQVKATFKPQ